MADDLDEEWWKDEGDAVSDNEDVRNDIESGDGEAEGDAETSEPKKKKKKWTRKRKRITDELREKGDKPSEPEDFLAYLKKHFDGKLSAVEQDELKLDIEKNFHKPNTSPEFVVAYLRSLLPKWKKMKEASQSEGSPMLLIICPSALRTVDLNRQLQDFKGDKCKCAKLFAKHMKLEEQQKFLKKSVCHMGIGTPNRIIALLKSGHLKLDHLSTVIVDWNWRDIKKRRLVDVPELRAELATLLQTYLIPNMKSHLKCKIGML